MNTENMNTEITEAIAKLEQDLADYVKLAELAKAGNLHAALQHHEAKQEQIRQQIEVLKVEAARRREVAADPSLQGLEDFQEGSGVVLPDDDGGGGIRDEVDLNDGSARAGDVEPGDIGGADPSLGRAPGGGGEVAVPNVEERWKWHETDFLLEVMEDTFEPEVRLHWTDVFGKDQARWLEFVEYFGEGTTMCGSTEFRMDLRGPYIMLKRTRARGPVNALAERYGVREATIRQWLEQGFANLEGPGRTREEMAADYRELQKVAPTPGDKLQLMFGMKEQGEASRATAAFEAWLNQSGLIIYGVTQRLEARLLQLIRSDKGFEILCGDWLEAAEVPRPEGDGNKNSLTRSV